MTKKMIIAAMLLVAVIIGGTGCMLKKQPSSETKPSTNELALAYMEEKYGETFTYYGPWGDSMTGTRQILVTCDSLPEQTIVVQIENFRDEGNSIYRDNFLAVKYRKETVEYFEKLANEYFDKTRVVYEVALGGQSVEMSAEAALEEYLADSGAEMVVMIEVSAGCFSGKDQINDLIDDVKKTCGNVSLTVIVVDDELFGTLDRKGLGKLISHREFVCCAVAEIDSNFRLDWIGDK